jgi:hypothetical protein
MQEQEQLEDEHRMNFDTKFRQWTIFLLLTSNCGPFTVD